MANIPRDKYNGDILITRETLHEYKDDEFFVVCAPGDGIPVRIRLPFYRLRKFFQSHPAAHVWARMEKRNWLQDKIYIECFTAMSREDRTALQDTEI